MSHRSRMLLVGAAILVGGCTATPATPAWTATPVREPAGPVANARLVEVYKSPTCSCCHEWEDYLRGHGWTVRSIPVDDLGRYKTLHGVPDDAASCHTAIIDGYVVEGHVPLEAIEDLLAARPGIDGIALAGMPAGSPGMPGAKAGPFQVLAIDGGATSAFGEY